MLNFTILASLLVTTVTSHIWEFLIYPILPTYRCCRARCSTCKNAYPDDKVALKMAFNQEKLNNIYDECQTFPLERAVARMTSILFTIIVFSNTIPVLYYIGFIYIFLTYLFHKLQILKARNINRGVKSEVMVQAFCLLLIAFMLRLAHGFIMYNDSLNLRSWHATKNSKDASALAWVNNG